MLRLERYTYTFSIPLPHTNSCLRHTSWFVLDVQKSFGDLDDSETENGGFKYVSSRERRRARKKTDKQAKSWTAAANFVYYYFLLLSLWILKFLNKKFIENSCMNTHLQFQSMLHFSKSPSLFKIPNQAIFYTLKRIYSKHHVPCIVLSSHLH